MSKESKSTTNHPLCKQAVAHDVACVYLRLVTQLVGRVTKEESATLDNSMALKASVPAIHTHTHTSHTLKYTGPQDP